MTVQCTKNKENNKIISYNVKLNNSHIGILRKPINNNEDFIKFQEFKFLHKFFVNYNINFYKNKHDNILIIYNNTIIFKNGIYKEEIFEYLKYLKIV